ncbi:acetylglutamate kinase [Myroides indicus]|uniref:Acetylglutamate kinase n=1 Tax=Myroides indicus TaxID=1323422 RepID=A0A4R7EMP7_9FLAO|nr:acetylglutamate kinase [Myroides indicus]TDS52163.1 N-acetylglutamate kinase [Myroides indicus]
MKNLTIVKIGGNVVDDECALSDFIIAFSELECPKILVHGGGKIATQIAAKLGIETKMIEGRRVTDKKMIPIAVMVYAGWINKQIVAQLQANQCNAIGVSGADGHLIISSKRSKAPVDYGYVGDFEASDVNANMIQQLLNIKLTPVFSAITADANGHLLNTNADTIASNIAIALAKQYRVTLMYCFEHKGVLENIKDKNSVISSIDKISFMQLKADGIISDGMLPKIENALNAIHKGVCEVYIKNTEDILDKSKGTIIHNK